MSQTTLTIGKEFPKDVIPLIKQAKKYIDIIVFDWRWYPNQIGASIQKFNNAIIVATRKHCRTRAIINSDQIGNVLSNENIKVKKLQSKGLIHTKLMIIDNKIAILGSHNYTLNAFTINQEISVIIQDEVIVKRLCLYFENLWW